MTHKAIINFGDDEEFLRIEGAELPAIPKKGDQIHIDQELYGANFTLEVEQVDQNLDGLLVIGSKIISGFFSPRVPIVEVCIWELDNDFPWGLYWQPGCKDSGVDGQIAEDEEGPLQWGWLFCPFCGAPLVQRREPKK